LPEISLLVHLRPGLSGVIGPKDAAIFRFDDCPYPVGVHRRNSDTDITDRAFGQSLVASDFIPGAAAIGRFEDAAARPPALQSPRLAIHFPQGSVDGIGIGRIQYQVGYARLIASKQDFLPVLAAVCGAKHSALFVRSEYVTLRADVNDIGIVRMNAHASDLPGVLESDVLPGFAGVRRFIDAVSV
jgi:hypothetical protein